MKGAIMLSGGGSGKLFAAIGVTYPAGSTLTCTNGTKTLKAKTTSGQWVFAIPEVGTWTVTSTDGTETASKSVSITAEGQSVSVVLSYTTYYYNRGKQVVAWSKGVKDYANGASASYITFSATSIDINPSGMCRLWAYTADPIDLTDIDTLYFNVKSASYTGSYKPMVGVFISADDIRGNGTGAEAFTQITQTITSETLVTVDVSALSGEYRPFVWGGIWDEGGGTATISVVEVYS